MPYATQTVHAQNLYTPPHHLQRSALPKKQLSFSRISVSLFTSIIHALQSILFLPRSSEPYLHTFSLTSSLSTTLSFSLPLPTTHPAFRPPPPPNHPRSPGASPLYRIIPVFDYNLQSILPTKSNHSSSGHYRAFPVFIHNRPSFRQNAISHPTNRVSLYFPFTAHKRLPFYLSFLLRFLRPAV